MSQSSRRPNSAALRAYRFINRPYYWYRPSQLVLRARSAASPDGTPRLLRTAWGAHLYCWPDALGQAVARTGVYDLIVAETLARLVDPGEVAVDAGANVGLMSNLLAHAIGPGGRVVSFEAHPLVLETLTRNVSLWQAGERIAAIDVRAAAVSSHAGSLPLAVDLDTFATNKGTASVERVDSDHSIDVESVRLDDELSTAIGVLKLDVEGHELEALRGADSLLSGRLVRDILFEEHRRPPTPVTGLLESYGYTILGVRQGLAGPIICTPEASYERQLWDPPALLATIDPERARLRLQRRGWICLRGHLAGRVA